MSKYTYTYVYIYMYMYAYMCVSHTHTYTYMHTHTHTGTQTDEGVVFTWGQGSQSQVSTLTNIRHLTFQLSSHHDSLEKCTGHNNIYHYMLYGTQQHISHYLTLLTS